MRKRRRALIDIVCRLILCALMATAGTAEGDDATTMNPPNLTIGLIADCQYADQPAAGQRLYRRAKDKLRACVSELNKRELDFVVQLGDLIDCGYESFHEVTPLVGRLEAPVYNVLGNHDYAVADARKAQVPGRLGLDRRYYQFERAGFRFLVLDGNEISFHAHPEGSAAYQRAADYHGANAPGAPAWNGAVGEEQLEWLEQALTEADEAGQRTVILCHFPVYPENLHNLWNAAEVLAVIDRHPCPAAYISGHNHAGNYGERNAVHYVTLRGMVDTETTAFALARLYKDRAAIEGFGREPDRDLRLSE
jgi:3',5'-cyclic AMP phosphodiesterase CpdA